jgi:acetylornithine deacetylase/succinyl-diaminopimelate desuccinylase-like protein
MSVNGGSARPTCVRWSRAIGPPTIAGLGPQGSRAHSEEEFIEPTTLVERTRMIARLLDLWAAGFEVAARP